MWVRSPKQLAVSDLQPGRYVPVPGLRLAPRDRKRPVWQLWSGGGSSTTARTRPEPPNTFAERTADKVLTVLKDDRFQRVIQLRDEIRACKTDPERYEPYMQIRDELLEEKFAVPALHGNSALR